MHFVPYGKAKSLGPETPRKAQIGEGALPVRRSRCSLLPPLEVGLASEARSTTKTRAKSETTRTKPAGPKRH